MIDLFRWLRLWEWENTSKPEDFITMLIKLQEDCGVADLKMSDYGIGSLNSGMVKNAKETAWACYLPVRE